MIYANLKYQPTAFLLYLYINYSKKIKVAYVSCDIIVHLSLYLKSIAYLTTYSRHEDVGDKNAIRDYYLSTNIPDWGFSAILNNIQIASLNQNNSNWFGSLLYCAILPCQLNCGHNTHSWLSRVSGEPWLPTFMVDTAPRDGEREAQHVETIIRLCLGFTANQLAEGKNEWSNLTNKNLQHIYGYLHGCYFL